jgi:hypothetical protein
MMTQRILIFSPLVKKWETGRKEKNTVTGVMEFVRDNGSWICHCGDEIAIAPLPSKPQRKVQS